MRKATKEKTPKKTGPLGEPAGASWLRARACDPSTLGAFQLFFLLFVLLLPAAGNERWGSHSHLEQRGLEVGVELSHVHRRVERKHEAPFALGQNVVAAVLHEQGPDGGVGFEHGFGEGFGVRFRDGGLVSDEREANHHRARHAFFFWRVLRY
jgi:hypothetical protein